jgi:hypothetical protein
MQLKSSRNGVFMKRTLLRLGLLAAAATVATTALWSSGATAAPQSSALVAGSYRAAYLNGVTTGTYNIIPPVLGIQTSLQLSGKLTSSGGCYTAQVGVRQSGVWKYVTAATNCSTTPVSYTLYTTSIITLSPAFGVRVCAVGGACGPVTQLGGIIIA